MANIKNSLGDLNNILFEQLERLNDDEALKDDETFEREMKRSKAITSIASQIVQNGNLSLRACQYAAEYGKEVTPVIALVEEK